MKTLRYLPFLLVSWFCAASFAQDNAMQQLIRGKKFFWEAKFDNALSALNNVLSSADAKTEFLFEANVYIGFILIRRNGPSLEADSYFERAVRLDPKRELDMTVIPPDLAGAFNAVKEKLYGCVYVISDPPQAEVKVVTGDSIGVGQTTPATICDLVGNPYQLLLKMEGFDGRLLPLALQGGATDTLRVKLEPTVVRKAGGGTKLWAWLVRGGVVASAGALLYLTIVDNPQEAADTGLLPSPPERPAN